MLGKVFNQDLFNMARVQQGLETTRKPGVTLGNYQESKIRWLHQRLADFMVPSTDDGRPSRSRGSRPMKGIVHPLTGALYERDGEFDRRGRRRCWSPTATARDGSDPTASGSRASSSSAIPQLCGWVAGPQVPHHRIAKPD